MKRIKETLSGFSALAALLTACSPYTVLIPPSPELCRDHGVAVADSDIPNGEIVGYHLADVKTVSARCQRPFSEVKGCAIAVGPGEYVIWSVDDLAVRTHEECAALFDLPRHEHTQIGSDRAQFGNEGEADE